jgi:hypothetical protein
MVTPQLHDAPPGLDSPVRFFIARLRLGQLERGLESENPVLAYNAYDGEGRLLERLED